MESLSPQPSNKEKPIFIKYRGKKYTPVKRIYSPVLTFDGVTPNPEYKSKLIRHL
jgi:ABC-type microcin C transport system permease subunit YejE